MFQDGFNQLNLAASTDNTPTHLAKYAPESVALPDLMRGYPREIPVSERGAISLRFSQDGRLPEKVVPMEGWTMRASGFVGRVGALAIALGAGVGLNFLSGGLASAAPADSANASDDADSASSAPRSAQRGRSTGSAGRVAMGRSDSLQPIDGDNKSRAKATRRAPIVTAVRPDAAAPRMSVGTTPTAAAAIKFPIANSSVSERVPPVAGVGRAITTPAVATVPPQIAAATGALNRVSAPRTETKPLSPFHSLISTAALSAAWRESVRPGAVTPTAAVTSTGQAPAAAAVVASATNSVLATIPLSLQPSGIAVNPKLDRVYVTGSDKVVVINTTDNSVVDTVDVGAFAIPVAVNPAGTRLYVGYSSGNNDAGSIRVIDTAGNTVIGTVALAKLPDLPGGGVGTAKFPAGIAVNPAGTKVYVTHVTTTIDTSRGTISVIDTSDNSVSAVISVDGTPAGVAFNPAGTRAYVAHSGSVSVINTSTNEAIATIPVGGSPNGVAVNAAGTRVYVSNLNGSVAVINTNTNAKVTDVTPIGGEATAVAVNPSGSAAYVPNYMVQDGLWVSNGLAVVNTATNTVIGKIKTSEAPDDVAINAAGTRAYVMNYGEGVPGSVSVVDIVQPVVSIGNVEVTEGNSGTKNAAFTVSLSKASATPVTADFATVNGTATAGTDYTAKSGTVSFAPNQTSATINVIVAGDTVVESDEAFTVKLSAPSGATLGTSTATGTIRNDDTSVSISNATVVEGNSGTKAAAFTVSLSKALPTAVSVNYATANGTATAGTDYTAASGKVTFAAGTTSQVVNVNVLGDTAVENNETFTVALSAPTVGATLGNATGTGTIRNDDTVVSIGDASVTEGNSGSKSAGFTVSLSKASAVPVSVKWATANGTATAGSDYTAGSGTVSFAAGETSKTVNVTVVGDSTVEPNETFTVNLSAPTNATLGTAKGTGTIRNDDGPAISIGNASVSEGNSGSKAMVFTVTLSKVAASEVKVNYATANGTATAGSDYTAASGTLTFAAGTTSKTFNVSVLGDTVSEPNEAFTVTLSAPTGGYLGQATATGTILNDEASRPPVIGTTTVGAPDSDTGAVAGQITATDPDGDFLTYSASTSAKGVTINLNSKTGQFTYLPTLTLRRNAYTAYSPSTVVSGLDLINDAQIVGTKAYISTLNFDTFENTVAVVDTVAKTVNPTRVLPGGLTGMTVKGDGTLLYLNEASETDGTARLTVRNSSTLNVVGTPLGFPDSYGGGIAINTTGTRAYLGTYTYNLVGETYTQTGSVQVVDTSGAPQKLTSVAVGDGMPSRIVVSPNGRYVYVKSDIYAMGSPPTSVLKVIDTQDSNKVTVVPVTQPANTVVFSSDGSRAYVGTVDFATGNASVQVIDTATNKRLTSIATFTSSVTRLAISPDGKQVYASTAGNSASDLALAIIDTATNRVTTSIPTVGGPHVIGFGSDTSRVFVNTSKTADGLTFTETIMSFKVNPTPTAATDTFTITVSDGKGGTTTKVVTVPIGPALPAVT